MTTAAVASLIASEAPSCLTEARGASREARLASVALITAFCGAYLGVNCGYQVPVESAQVVAGLVSYSADNPFYMYHVKTWTIVHQLAAALLRLGVDERQLSMVLGAVVAAVSFMALAFCTLIFCDRTWVAVVSPLLCLAAAAHGELEGVYPVRILSDNPWLFYGVLATSLTLLTWTLWGLGYRRVAAFLTGLAPSVHPTMGCWCAFVWLLAMLCQPALRSTWRTWVGWFVAGAAVSVASVFVQQVIARGLPVISAEERAAYVAAFAAGWDTHRRPFPLTDVTLLYAGCAIAICGMLLRPTRSQPHWDARFFCCCMIIASLGGVVLALSTHFEKFLPTVVMMAMPGRYINVVGLALPAMVLGALAHFRNRLLMEGVLFGIAAYACLRMLRFETKLYVPEIYYLILLGSFLVVIWGLRQPLRAHDEQTRLSRLASLLAWVGIAVVGARGAGWRWPLPAVIWTTGAAACLPQAFWARFERPWILTALRAVTGAAAAVLAWGVLGWLAACVAVMAVAARYAALIGSLLPVSRQTVGIVRAVFVIGAILAAVIVIDAQVVISSIGMLDHRSEPVLARAARGGGMLLSGPTVRSMQMFTRRPVVLEGAALNQLPYVPESGPSMNAILRAIYGDDLFEPRPPRWQRERGGLMHLSAKQLWEQRSVQEWQDLARQFGFTQIVTHSNWGLQLPVVGFSRRYILYAVPGVTEAAQPPRRPVHTVRESSDGRVQ